MCRTFFIRDILHLDCGFVYHRRCQKQTKRAAVSTTEKLSAASVDSENEYSDSSSATSVDSEDEYSDSSSVESENESSDESSTSSVDSEDENSDESSDESENESSDLSSVDSEKESLDLSPAAVENSDVAADMSPAEVEGNGEVTRAAVRSMNESSDPTPETDDRVNRMDDVTLVMPLGKTK